MNEEKLENYINLLDHAIAICLERRCVMRSEKFYQTLINAGWITQDDIDKGRDHIESKYPHFFNYDWLDNNIIQGLYFRKCKTVFKYIENDLEKYPKGMRPTGNFTRGISEMGHEMWADELYNYAIYNACGAVEDYFNHELE